MRSVILTEVRVRLWKNFVDSGWVPIDRGVTCLVGKNESGKTAFLEALYRLKPAYKHNSSIDLDMDYPRWRKVEDARTKDLEKQEFIMARFALTQEETDMLSEVIGAPIPESTTVEVSRAYSGTRYYRIKIPEADAVKALLQSRDALKAFEHSRQIPSSLDDLFEVVKAKRHPSLRGIQRRTRILQELIRGNYEYSNELLTTLSRMLPTFFYFSDYSRLKGHIDLDRVLAKNPEELQDHERTARDLLDLVGVSGDDLTEARLERRIAELEAAAAEITRQVFRYWTQNRHLRVSLVTEPEIVRSPQGQEVVHRFLNIRLLDERHHVTTNFETRSSGFRWFFSFIVAFSPFKKRRDVIVLLDEPGLSLHGRAQADFLRFVEQELAPTNQVIYTTHSPFLVDPSKLERVRAVEDHTSVENPDSGAVVRADAFSRDRDTLFPLQAALGYDLAQNLIIGSSEHLVVEGTTDFIYLDTLSEYLKKRGRTGLDDRFTIVPVGGAQNIPTFVALLGAHLPVSALVDSSAKGMQRINHMIKEGLLEASRLVTISQVTGTPEADIEDLFRPEEYLMLYNGAFGASVSVSDLDGRGPIVKQIERHVGGRFEHGPPATYLLRNKIQILEKLSEETLSRFERLFELLNATIR